jgi:hypothetical protein
MLLAPATLRFSSMVVWMIKVIQVSRYAFHSLFAGIPILNVFFWKANLDIQYTTGLSFPTPNIYYR